MAVGREPASSVLPAWAIESAEVAYKASPGGDASGRDAGKAGMRITSVLPSGMLMVAGCNEAISPAELVPVAPNKKDTVRLLSDDRSRGTVIGLDGPDAVIRVDGTADFRIVPISSLVKIAPS